MPGRIDQGIQVRNPFSELSVENSGNQQPDIDRSINVNSKQTSDADLGFSFGEKQTRKAEAGMHGQIAKSELLDKLKISERAKKIHGALSGPKTDEKALSDALAGLDKKEREQLEKEYKKKYGTSLNDALRGKVSGSQLNGDEKTLFKQMMKEQNKNMEKITRNL
jgi:hypothetical protein